MSKQETIAGGKLIDYAKKFLRVNARTDETICVTLEQVAAFAAQVRDGCMQDLQQLIEKLAAGHIEFYADRALRALAESLREAQIIELWGLPDCVCKKDECVYCGRGFAINPTEQLAEGEF